MDLDHWKRFLLIIMRLYPLCDCKLWAHIHYVIVNYDGRTLKS